MPFGSRKRRTTNNNRDNVSTLRAMSICFIKENRIYCGLFVQGTNLISSNENCTEFHRGMNDIVL